MAADKTAIDYLCSHGPRTASRLRDLAYHFARLYGEDPDQQIAAALCLAQRTVRDFVTDICPVPDPE